jgi:hypothetical protein
LLDILLNSLLLNGVLLLLLLQHLLLDGVLLLLLLEGLLLLLKGLLLLLQSLLLELHLLLLRQVRLHGTAHQVRRLRPGSCRVTRPGLRNDGIVAGP